MAGKNTPGNLVAAMGCFPHRKDPAHRVKSSSGSITSWVANAMPAVVIFLQEQDADAALKIP